MFGSLVRFSVQHNIELYVLVSYLCGMLCILERKNYFGSSESRKLVNVTQDNLKQVFVNGLFRTNRAIDALNVWMEHSGYGEKYFTRLTPINKHHKLTV